MKKLLFLTLFIVYFFNGDIVFSASTFCEDPDGGKNYTEFSTVKADGYQRLDVCMDARSSAGSPGNYCWGDYCQIKEYYCSSDLEILSETHDCPEGCSEGACINIPTQDSSNSCFDFDGDGSCAKFVSPVKGAKIKAGDTIEIKWIQKNIKKYTLGVHTGGITWIEYNKEVDPTKSEHAVKWTVPSNYVGKEDIYFSLQFFYIRDSSGNLPKGTVYSDTFSVVDASPQEEIDKRPIISNLRAEYDYPNNKVFIKWDTNEESTTKIIFRQLQVQNVFEMPIGGASGYTKNHVVEKGGITPLIVFTYRAVSTNKTGQETISPAKRFAANDYKSFVPYVGSEIKKEEGSSKLKDVSIIGNNNETKIIIVKNKTMHSRLKGKIMLKVGDSGKAYYVNPRTETMHYLGRPEDAFSVMREQGVGITNQNLEKIPIGLSSLSGDDSDGDGLSDMFEDAIGTDKLNSDTDGDGFSDKNELQSGYSPKLKMKKMSYDYGFTDSNNGKIFLQVEGRGEAWYLNPEDGRRYFLGRPGDAFNVMRNLGLGISNNDFGLMVE